ncbi:MAG: hypothetical protein GY820_48335 [Gammaproteobacteria bacterium]|nr:hypothetical protein [Gammaproteobacteria bacterium]
MTKPSITAATEAAYATDADRAKAAYNKAKVAYIKAKADAAVNDVEAKAKADAFAALVTTTEAAYDVAYEAFVTADPDAVYAKSNEYVDYINVEIEAKTSNDEEKK